MKLTSPRNLFNRDCDLVFYQFRNRPKSEPLTALAAATAIQRSVDVLADNGIDTLLINPNTQVAWYPSKTVPTALTGYRRGDANFTRGSAIACGVPADQIDGAAKEIARFLDTFLDVEEAGVDWLAEVATACRKRSVCPWLSVRMNDMHATVDPDPRTHAEAYENGPLFKNPANRLRGTHLNPADGTFTYFMGINYERQEVRDYMLAMIRDLVENYDYEGLELDWLRNPLCCEPNATQKTIDTITRWITHIHALTEAKAKKIGRPYPLGLRIPGQLGKMRAIGLDVRALARDGLIDFICPSNFWQTSWDMPHDRLRSELGPGVAIYGVIEGVTNWLSCYSPTTVGKMKPPGNHVEATVRFLATSLPLLRGNAAGKLALGADGIMHFNFFIAESGWCQDFGMRIDYGDLRGLDDLEALRGKPKQYTLSTPPTDLRSPPFCEMSEQLPAWIEPEQRRAFTLPMCAEPSNANLELVIQVVIEKPESPVTSPDLGVSFNGSWPGFEAKPTDELLFPASIYTHHIARHRAFNYHLPVSAIREGWNEIIVYNENHRRATLRERLDNAVNVVSVEVAVK